MFLVLGLADLSSPGYIFAALKIVYGKSYTTTILFDEAVAVLSVSFFFDLITI